ncbi:MAG: putative hydroxymethylpyrimidine transporter CytX [Desulfoferrobacter sp.]
MTKDRNLGGVDYFLLWSGAAISLAEIWAGGLMVPLGLSLGLLAIILGHLIGNTFLALGGLIGSRQEVPTMVGVRPSFGIRGSYLPSILNVVQLIGWTAVMLLICGSAAHNLASSYGFSNQKVWILASGIITTLWALSGHRHWKWLHRIAVSALLGLCVVLSIVVFHKYSITELWKVPTTGEFSFMLGLDLVIAMPISWLPLVSDYSRFAKKSRQCFWGTWLGYFIMSSWMYALGLAAALATASPDPSEIVLQLMVEYGLAVPALFVVVFSTFTTTFLDIYSAAVSSTNIFPKVSEKWTMVGGGVLGTLLALVFPVTQYENFLLFIGGMFCPIFGIVLTDYFLLRGGNYPPEAFTGEKEFSYAGGINVMALIAWTVGFGIYELGYYMSWQIGSSMPGMISAGLTYMVLMRLKMGRSLAYSN